MKEHSLPAQPSLSLARFWRRREKLYMNQVGSFFPYLPSFVFAVLYIRCFNVASGYFHVSANLVTVPIAWILILYIFSILISYNPVARAEIVSKGTNLTCPSIDRPVSARSSLWSIWSTFIGVGELARGISAGFSLRTPGELKTAISDSGKKTDTDDITKKSDLLQLIHERWNDSLRNELDEFIKVGYTKAYCLQLFTKVNLV